MSEIFKTNQPIAVIDTARDATNLIVSKVSQTISIRYVMGLKKRRLSRSGAANKVIIATTDGSSAYPGMSALKKALGFFGHVAWQASGWREIGSGVKRN